MRAQFSSSEEITPPLPAGVEMDEIPFPGDEITFLPEGPVVRVVRRGFFVKDGVCKGALVHVRVEGS